MINIIEEHIEISDGYHTFDELHDHRMTLFLALCRQLMRYSEQSYRPWRSKLHGDGSAYEGWFIMGKRKEKGEQITYHLPLSGWEETGFAETLAHASEWDGHTSQDVLDR